MRTPGGLRFGGRGGWAAINLRANKKLGGIGHIENNRKKNAA